jgi:uncharacterized protein with PQ loop repeat
VKELAVAACLAALIALPLSALAYLVHAFLIIISTGNYMPQPEPAIHLGVLAVLQTGLTLLIKIKIGPKQTYIHGHRQLDDKG